MNVNGKKMAIIKLEFLNTKGKVPEYATIGSSGCDLIAAVDSPIVIKSGRRAIIPTGIAISIPEGYEAQLRPRSGLALKYGITVLNTPGTIDADYRGEIGVILINLSKNDFTVKPGDKIAQLVFAKVEKVKFQVVRELDNTQRNKGGFGHSDISSS